MKNILLVYIHVHNDDAHKRMAREFIRSYRQFQPGFDHQTVIVCQGGAPDEATAALFKEALPGCSFFYHNDVGWDIGAFIALAKHLVKNDIPVEFMICCGGSTYFRKAGWLKRIADSWRKLGPGFYGANSTYEVSPHLNTSGFWCEPKLLASYPITVTTQEQRYDFEHGPNALWKLAYAAGIKVRLVTWCGEYEWKDWRKPENLFRRGDQSNCLIYWHHHTKYEVAHPSMQKAMRRNTDILADPLHRKLLYGGVEDSERPYLEAQSLAYFRHAHGFHIPKAPVRIPRTPRSITVVAVTAIAPASHAKAIDLTAACIPYPCKRLLFSNSKPAGYDGDFAQDREMLSASWSMASVQQFVLYELFKYIETELVILVHWDGYALNKSRWDNHFFDFDYIGAPWPRAMFKQLPMRLRHGRVGNGGFSLRSTKWLRACSTLPPSGMNEDFYASCMNRQHFEKLGCRIAPVDVAMRWSFEHRVEEFPNWKLEDSFGFHGLTDKDPARSHLKLNPNE